MADRFLDFSDRFMQMYIQSQAMKLQSERYKQAERRYTEGLAQRKLEHEDINRYRTGMLEQSRERTRLYGERDADTQIKIFTPGVVENSLKDLAKESFGRTPTTGQKWWLPGFMEKTRPVKGGVQKSRENYRIKIGYDTLNPWQQQQADAVWNDLVSEYDIGEEPDQRQMFDQRSAGYEQPQGQPPMEKMSPFRVPEKTRGQEQAAGPQTEEEFEAEVMRLKRIDVNQARAYYDQWADKW